MAFPLGDIFPALEEFDVARYSLSPDKKSIMGFAGLGAQLQPAIIVSKSAPVNADGRPDGTIWVQVT